MAKFLNSIICFFLILSAAMTITQVNAQQRCTDTLTTKDCTMAECQSECLKKHNGNGVCTGGNDDPLSCVCVYNC
ncbi:putative defensin-like protein [Capsicum galapagoense]